MLKSDKLHGSFEIDGFCLNYVIEGKGPNALVIGSSVYYPRVFSENLRSHLRMVFIDHRGFGKALEPFTNAPFELDKIVDDIEAIRQKLDLGKVIIIGHSGHGYMALRYASKYPASVSHVVVIAMSPDGSAESHAAANRYFQESVCPERKEQLAKNLAILEHDIAANPQKSFIIRMLTFGPMIWYTHDYDAAWLWEGVEVIPEMFDYVWGKLFQEITIAEDLEKLECPLFLGLGRYDYWNPPYLWEVMRSKAKNLRLRVFEQSGHTPPLEEPLSFDAELLSWLAEK